MHLYLRVWHHVRPVRLYSSDSVICVYLNLSNWNSDRCHSLNESFMFFFTAVQFRLVFANFCHDSPLLSNLCTYLDFCYRVLHFTRRCRHLKIMRGFHSRVLMRLCRGNTLRREAQTLGSVNSSSYGRTPRSVIPPVSPDSASERPSPEGDVFTNCWSIYPQFDVRYDHVNMGHTALQ